MKKIIALVLSLCLLCGAVALAETTKTTEVYYTIEPSEAYTVTIPAGVTEVQTSMQNPEANEGWYYLTFQLRLKDTNEVIFTTGLIPPGQYCNKVTHTRALEPGEYAAIIHVQPYRISDQSPTNNADMETVLIVK